MSANGSPGRDPVPVLPWRIDLVNSTIHYEKPEAGGMIVALTPLVATPDGQAMLCPPQIVVRFDAAGWERFQREVAADGVRSQVAVARILPDPQH